MKGFSERNPLNQKIPCSIGFRMLSSERWMRRGPKASALVVGVDDQHVPSTSVAEGIFDGTAVI